MCCNPFDFEVRSKVVRFILTIEEKQKWNLPSYFTTHTMADATAGAEGGISKNQLKKMQKAEEAARKKAEKDAAKAAKAASEPPKPKKAGVEAEPEELDPTKYFENRSNAITSLEKSGTSAFPHKFHNSHRFAEYVTQFSSIADGEHLKDIVASISGIPDWLSRDHFFVLYLLTSFTVAIIFTSRHGISLYVSLSLLTFPTFYQRPCD